ncbi:MAG TPA: nidogen-like domain-containing protein [Thermoleophilaceae bacterium]|nr:nidogen-like domain-containing protein [Thermoleophilaceae bacterium]
MRIRIALARLAALAVLVVLLSLTTASAASAGAVQTLDGCTAGTPGATTLPANDDNSTGAVPLPFTVDFFGDEYTQAYVNNNGNVTFDGPQSTFTPFDFTISGIPMIAPFLADVDTLGSGSGVVTYGNAIVDGRDAFCVNWVGVGYFSSHTDKLNSFQLLLVEQDTPGDFDIVFNYDKVQWETGDASGGSGGFGGTPAAAGWANGDGEHFDLRPGSFDSMALLDSNASTGLVHGMLGSTQPGRYVFQVRNTGVSGPALEGQVQHSAGGDVVNGPVEICPDAGGPCRVRNTNQAGTYRATGLAAGTYSVTANPPADSDETAASTQVTMGAADVVAPVLTLGPAPQPPPAGTTIESVDTSSNGIPVVIVGTSPRLVTAGCPGGTATFEIKVDGQSIASGALAETPAGSGRYSGATGVLNAVGDANVTIAIVCPDAADDETIEFGLYIDPSGHVRDSTGAPIPDATVELFRSASSSGPFAPVPDGSAVMSPSNRTNPDLTDADGHFGWDVVAGYYKVRASKDGCVGNANRAQPFAESHVMTIPPPVTDLDIRLYCGEGGGGGGGGAGGGGGGGGSAGSAGGGGGGGSAGGGSSSSFAFASFGTIKLSGAKVGVPVFCASAVTTACAGSVTIKAKQGKKKRAKRITIGSAKFSGVAPGTTKRVGVKLNRTGRKLLKKGKVKATVAMKVRAGSGTAAQNVTRTVTLARPKKKGK